LHPEFSATNIFHQTKENFMLIVEVKDGEAIDKVLKKYKRKFERAGILKELRRRKAFSKPSVERRAEVLKAVYKEETYGNKND
jgi:small subunit ribosomal protein S21